MRAPGEHDYLRISDASFDELPRVPRGCRHRPTGNRRVGSLHNIVERVGERAQAASKHYADHTSIPAMQADMKFAMVPHATSFIPSRARSDLRDGARAPMPPT